MSKITDEAWKNAKAKIKTTADAVREMEGRWSLIDGYGVASYVEDQPAMASFCLLKMTETLRRIQDGQKALRDLEQ